MAAFPAGAPFDYQIGGAFAPAAGVRVVSRDRSDQPDRDRYSICYVNAYQAQPQELDWWRAHHPDLLLRDNAGRLGGRRGLGRGAARPAHACAALRPGGGRRGLDGGLRRGTGSVPSSSTTSTPTCAPRPADPSGRLALAEALADRGAPRGPGRRPEERPRARRRLSARATTSRWPRSAPSMPSAAATRPPTVPRWSTSSTPGRPWPGLPGPGPADHHPARPRRLPAGRPGLRRRTLSATLTRR